MDHVLALDVGGTKLAAGVVDDRGELLVRAQVPTPADDAAALGAAVKGLLGEVREAAGVPLVACGVGCGGPMTRGGAAVSPLNIGAWRGYPLRDEVAALTGLATWVDNDAKALALGEGWVGAARGATDYLAMVVSTGVGGGLVLDGRLLDGADGNAGHIGHVNAVPGGRRCACGALGCLEAEASGTAIAARTGRPPREAPEAERVRTGELVGRVVASAVALLDVRLAVVAGSVALGYGDVFFHAAQRVLDEQAAIGFARGAVIRPGGLGDRGPLVGAAAVARRGLGLDVGVR